MMSDIKHLAPLMFLDSDEQALSIQPTKSLDVASSEGIPRLIQAAGAIS